MSFRVLLCKCSVGLGLGLGKWILHVFPATVSWASEREQTWSLFECLAELLEFACVESEGSVVRPSHDTLGCRVVYSSNCPDAHPVLDRFPEGQQH